MYDTKIADEFITEFPPSRIAELFAQTKTTLERLEFAKQKLCKERDRIGYYEDIAIKQIAEQAVRNSRSPGILRSIFLYLATFLNSLVLYSRKLFPLLITTLIVFGTFISGAAYIYYYTRHDDTYEYNSYSAALKAAKAISASAEFSYSAPIALKLFIASLLISIFVYKIISIRRISRIRKLNDQLMHAAFISKDLSSILEKYVQSDTSEHEMSRVTAYDWRDYI